MAWSDADVTHVDGVQGGAPVLAGTRTPVGTVVAYYRNYDGDIGQVRRALGHLSEQQIRAALAYYAEHGAEVDADEARHERALEALFAAS